MDYHCENTWLPTRGTRDAIYLDEGDGPYEYLSLLIPYEWRRCFCSDTDNLPKEVVIND